MRAIRSFLVCVIAIGSQLGCSLLVFGGGAVAGAGMVAYAKGELSAADEVELDRVWDAAQGAMEDLDFTIESRHTTATSAKLVARGADSRRVTVVLEERVGEFTEIRIRIGFFGDEALSRVILNRMRRRLGVRALP